MKLKSLFKLFESKKYRNKDYDREKPPSEVLKRMGQPEYRMKVAKAKKGKGSYNRKDKTE